jgi:aryl-alcohol dehydrogenase-like predicted oxidoreductase
MGTLVWSPLAGGMLTGRFRKGQDSDLARVGMFRHNQDERRIEAVEQVVALSEETGIRMTHLALAFAIAHPGVTSALIGPRSMEQLDDLLAGADVVLSDEVLDRIDAIVPPGTDVGRLDQQYEPPVIRRAELRRRPVADRPAAV